MKQRMSPWGQTTVAIGWFQFNFYWLLFLLGFSQFLLNSLLYIFKTPMNHLVIPPTSHMVYKKRERERRELASTSHPMLTIIIDFPHHHMTSSINATTVLNCSINEWNPTDSYMYTCSVAQPIFTNYTTLNLLVNYPPNSIIK